MGNQRFMFSPQWTLHKDRIHQIIADFILFNCGFSPRMGAHNGNVPHHFSQKQKENDLLSLISLNSYCILTLPTSLSSSRPGFPVVPWVAPLNMPLSDPRTLCVPNWTSQIPALDVLISIHSFTIFPISPAEEPTVNLDPSMSNPSPLGERITHRFFFL